MTPQQYQQLKEHFYALEEGDSSAREEYLARLPEEERVAVEALLATRDDDFLESSPVTGAEPKQVGPYVVVQEIGRGGMGVVYLASRSDEQFRQRVALKLIKFGLDTDAIVARFRRERQILATLEHPNIARLLDGGTTQDGHPYYVMEYIEGERVDEYCRAGTLEVDQVVRLFRHVCAAVQYAHQKLVIHRDLKPGNILVTTDGTPKLLDFGIAKLLTEDGQTRPTELTAAEIRPLTPDYASPEQLRGEPMTTASDVYSLGVVLYELLTGRLPFDLSGRTPEERARAIDSSEPRRPSAAIAKRGANTTRIRRALAGDLDTILLKSLRGDASRRYASVADLDADLGRYLEGFPVIARPDTFTYRLSKFVRRNSMTIAVAALLLAALLGGLLTTSYEARRARLAQARAERISLDARRMASTLVFDVHDAIAHVPGAAGARTMLVRSAVRYFDALAKESSDDPVVQRELALAYTRLGSVFAGTGLSDYDSASRSYRKALRIQQTLLRQRPGDLGLQRELAATYDLMMEGGGEVGLGMALRNIAVRERIVARNPGDIRDRRALALAVQHASDFLGNPYWNSLNQPLRAIQYSQRAIALREAILRDAPGDAVSHLELAMSESEYAAVLWACGRLTDAFEHETRSQSIYDETARMVPSDSEVLREAAGSRIRMVRYLEALGRYPEALASARESVDRYERLAPADPKNGLLQGERVSSLTTYGRALRETGNVDDALNVDRTVLRLIDSTPVMHVKETRRGRAELEYAKALALKQDLAAADAHARRAAAILQEFGDSRAAEALVVVGDMSHARGATSEARAAYQRAVALASAASGSAIGREILEEAKSKLAALP